MNEDIERTREYLRRIHQRPPNDPPVDPPSVRGDDGDMNERVAALEAKWEAVIPTLPTKADLLSTKADLTAEVGGVRRELDLLRSDMHKASNDQIRWIVGTGIAGIAIFLTVMTFVLNNAVPKAPAPSAAPTIIMVPQSSQAPTAQASPPPAPKATP